MTISELICNLQCIKCINGDLEICLQYQDGGGFYDGSTDGSIDVRVEEKLGRDVIVLS